MTSSYNATYARFCVFYSDDRLTGHCFLRPSIFAKQAAEWIVSPLPTSKWEKSIEILGRVILTITLPILALLAAILIPFGLICKSISSRWFPPPPKQELPKTFKPYTLFPKQRTKGEDLKEEVLPEISLFPIEPEERWAEIFDRAHLLLDEVYNKLSDCIFTAKALELLYEIRKAIQTDSDLKLISTHAKEKEAPYGEIQSGVEEILNFIEVLIFHQTHFPVSEDGTSEPRQGFLLFFFEAYATYNPHCLDLDLDEETEKIRVWILKNYKNDSQLRRYLTLSIIQHYHLELKKLREEVLQLSLAAENEKGKQKLVEGGDIGAPDLQKEARVSELLHTLQQLSKADASPHESLFINYLDYEEYKTRDIGPAEIYTLCQLYRVCVKIKHPLFKECRVMGEEFAGEERKPLVIHTGYFI